VKFKKHPILVSIVSVCEKKKFWSKMKVEKFVKKRLPIICWLPHYTFSTLLHDLLAGLTVGATEIPQAIAYALLAGLLNLPNGTTCDISHSFWQDYHQNTVCTQVLLTASSTPFLELVKTSTSVPVPSCH
jgi:hypothetical protein